MNKKIYIWILTIGCMNLLYFIPGLSQSDPLPTDPGRVRIDSNSYGYQVVNENGDILRGNAIWLWKAKINNNFSEVAYAFDSSYYQTLADSGVNTIRLALFDPWVNSNTTNYDKVLDYSNQSELEWMLEYTDSVVNFASKYNMNVLINYHDVGKYKGEYGNPDANNMGYLRDFWTAIAPYYKNRTHVFYELMNEPAFGCSNFTNELFDSIVVLHDLVRTMAPETHLSLFCYTAAVGKTWDEQTMYTAMQRFEQRYSDDINWNKASVAFHPYVSDSRTSDPILNTMEQYPLINTESNFPCDPAVHENVMDADEQCQAVDGEIFINQTMERLGVSWLHHKANGWDHFNNNWVLILKDAREKGYIWFGDYTEHIMNITAENGWVDPREDTLRVQAGHKIRFEAHPDDGYRFEKWTGDITSSDNPVYVNLSGSESFITANFVAIDSFNVSTQGTNGWIRLDPPGGRYIDSTIVNIWAMPDSGYIFSKWNSNDVIEDTLTARQDIIVTKDLNLVAQFASTEGISDATANSQKITVNPNPVEGDNIHITLHVPVKDNVIIRIYDITGREVYVGTHTGNEINIPITKLKGLQEGLIIIEVETDENIYRKKSLVY